MHIVALMALLVLAVSLRDTLAKTSSTGFKVGEPFPALVLPSLKDGTPLSLAQFRGQKLILHIFASW